MGTRRFLQEMKLKIKGMFEISFFDAIYKIVIYKDIFITISPFLLKKKIWRSRIKQQQSLLRLRNKKQKILVAFFLQNSSIWKYDKLYTLLEQSKFFSPVVVITPYNVHLNYDKKECLKVMEQAGQFAQQKGYRYIMAFDAEKKRWLNIKKELNPDIIFFTKPYKDTLPAYHIYNFKEKITCYISYGYDCLNYYRRCYNLPFHNLLYHFFVETKFQHGFAREYSLMQGENVIVSGGVGIEPLIDKKQIIKDVWKPQPVRKKRIIWAPHHTIDYMFNFSNFLNYCEIMLDLAEKYKQEIQLAFKPHPVLKFKLINLWGAQKTEDYYRRWQLLLNTQLEDGYYTDLFLSSDAMIHDSVSFTAEYLHTLKPVLFTVRNEAVIKRWNPFGIQVFNLHYRAYNKEDIEHFIRKVVIEGEDTMYKARKDFYDSYLYPKDGIMPSEKILQTLERDIAAT